MANTDNNIAIAQSKLALRLENNLSTLYRSFTAQEVEWPNVAFDTPENGPWLRFTVNSAGVVDQDASGCYELNRAFCTIATFYPRDSGSEDALNVANSIKSLFNGGIYDDLTIEQISVSPVPQVTGDNWYGVNTIITFSFEGYTS